MRVWHYVDNPVCGLLSHRHSAYLCKPLLSIADWLSFVLRCNCTAVWLYRSQAIWPEKKKSLPEKTTSGDEVLLLPLTTHKSAPGSPHVCLNWHARCSVTWNSFHEWVSVKGEHLVGDIAWQCLINLCLKYVSSSENIYDVCTCFLLIRKCLVLTKPQHPHFSDYSEHFAMQK